MIDLDLGLTLSHSPSSSLSRLTLYQKNHYTIKSIVDRMNDFQSIEGLIVSVHRGLLCIKEEARWAATADLMHKHVKGKCARKIGHQSEELRSSRCPIRMGSVRLKALCCSSCVLTRLREGYPHILTLLFDVAPFAVSCCMIGCRQHGRRCLIFQLGQMVDGWGSILSRCYWWLHQGKKMM